jgi:hypothetical protein
MAGGDGSRRTRPALVGALLLLLGVHAEAAVTLTASRSELLYSGGADPDCAALHATMDDTLLPLHVVRLRAVADGADPGGVRYRWSMPRPQVGTLAADLDLGPEEQTAAIRGLCAEFGNACILTPDKLPFYNQPTILYLAPTCDALPTRTERAYRGGAVKLRVKATEGGRKLGKAVTSVGFGRTGSIVLYSDGENGIGKPGGVLSDIQPFFSATVNPEGPLPPVKGIEFDNGSAASTTVPPDGCVGLRGVPYDACTSDLLYTRAGRFTAVVREKFEDGSALCDNLTVRVGTCEAAPRVEILTTPRRKLYTDGETVRLRVRLHNRSPRAGGCNFLLTGGSVLTCESTVEIGGTEDTRTTVFDLQRCSVTSQQSCTTDAECRPPICPDCDLGETCLTQSHCSTTLTRPCTHDSECEPPLCPDCVDDETCVRVLAIPQIVVPVGQSIDLVDSNVQVGNAFTDSVKLRDKWTATTFNAGADDATFSYRIRRRR